MGIIENAKEAVKLVQQIDNVELYRKILDLQAEAMELTEQLKEKDEIISQLKDALDLKGKLICQKSAYYLVDDKETAVDGPFCTKCFDVDHVKCRLVKDHTHGHVKCLNCKVSFSSLRTYAYLDRTE